MFLGDEDTYPESFAIGDSNTGVGRLTFTESAFGGGDSDVPLVEALGDINGDGYDDFAFTSTGLGDEEDFDGDTFERISVVFGGNDFGSRNLDTFSGISGFKIQSDLFPESQVQIKSIGDINGDGFSDFVYGPGVLEPRFGESTAPTLVLGRSNVNASIGTTLVGIATLDASGDFNGDGRNDPIFINSQLEAYILFEEDLSFANIPSIDNLDGIESLIFNFSNEFYSADYIGDFNGDGLDDVLLTVPRDFDSNEGSPAYVVFGQADVSSIADIDLTALDGSNGFLLSTPNGTEFIRAGGDVDGDGQTDLLIGGRVLRKIVWAL